MITAARTVSAPPALPPAQGRRKRTRLVTLHRLVEGTRFDDLDYIDEPSLGSLPWFLENVDIAGSRGLLIHAGEPARPADWCRDATTTTGTQVQYVTQGAGGLLILDVDGSIYAIGYGKGHYWLKDEAKDPRFGLNFTIRCLDTDQVQDLVRRTPGARGRTDSILVPGGASIWHLGGERHAEVVRRLGGTITDVPLTFSLSQQRPVNVEGAAGLRLRLGVEAGDLVCDLRAIAAVCRRPQPHPDLAFVENIMPTTSRSMIEQLDAQLEALLGESAPDAGRLTLAVPESALIKLSAAHAFRIRVGSAQARIVPRLEMEDILRRTRLQQPGRRLDSLRNGHVELLATDDGALSLGQTSAVKWIEATASLKERRFFLMEGQWYELAAGYFEEVRDYVRRYLDRTEHSVDLPAWQPEMHERDYNLHVADVRNGYLCLDRHGVTTRLHRTHGVEICDLLGPDNELIHVKHADASAPLSHLFSQGLVSARTLIDAPEARRKFAELVAERGRTIDEDFVPKKIVFAILLKQGAELTTETLFPFAQVMLRQTALYLEGKAEVEVIPITMAASA